MATPQAEEAECPDCPSMAPPWMATFADMATLLMAFFVLILSFAELNVPKYKAVTGQLKFAFGVQRDVRELEVPHADSAIAESFESMRVDPTLLRVIQERTTNEVQPEDPPLETKPKASIASANFDVRLLAQALAVEIAEGRVEIDVNESSIEVTVVESETAYSDSDMIPGKKGAQIDHDSLEIYAKLAEAKSLLKTDLIVIQRLDQKILERLRQRAADNSLKQAHISQQYQALELVLKDEIKSGDASLERVDDRFKLILKDKGLFLSGTAEMHPTLLRQISKVSDVIAPSSNRVLIKGHTDNRPIGLSNEFASNWDLSSARAAAIVNYMVNIQDIPQERFTVMGLADTQPLDSNETEEGRELNRRIEIILDY